MPARPCPAPTAAPKPSAPVRRPAPPVAPAIPAAPTVVVVINEVAARPTPEPSISISAAFGTIR
ncbi:hypothetical protein PK28_18390 (plasmid) [Hymenobacter sp. DG25B]|nr:hypothetical protein PK28_18390 [Hymenobacter sp. DG25B]